MLDRIKSIIGATASREADFAFNVIYLPHSS
jgi:hypothetical protein